MSLSLVEKSAIVITSFVILYTILITNIKKSY
nr:MAG TPA: hypothetical protein [Caudoviricetes sp.]